MLWLKMLNILADSQELTHISVVYKQKLHEK